MTLASGGDLKRAVASLRDGDTLELASGGVYSDAALYSLRRRITIRGNGAAIHGGTAAGLKFDRCGAIGLHNLTFAGARGAGLHVAECEGLEVRGCTAADNGGSGILTANTSKVVIQGCEARNNGSHGIYLSQSGDDLMIGGLAPGEGNLLRGNGKAGLQVNAVEGRKGHDGDHDWVSRRVTILGNRIDGNQHTGHGAAINLASVREAVIRGNVFAGHAGRTLIALFDGETRRAPYGCRGVEIGANSARDGFAPGVGRSCVSVTRTCSDVRIAPSNVWPAGITVLEEV